MRLSSECIVVRGPDGTVRVRPEDVVSVKEHRSSRPRMDPDEEVRLVLITRDLEHVVLPFRSRKLYRGVKAILAARDGDVDRLLRHLRRVLRKERKPPLFERREDGVWLRWPWLEVRVGPPERARRVVRELLEYWLRLLKESGRDPEDVSPRKVGLSVVLGSLSILFGGGKGKKGAAGAKVKAGAKGDAGGKTGGTALAKASKKLLLKMIKALMKLGVKVTFWTLVAFVVAVALVPLAVMSVVYWLIARRAYRWGSVPWLRGLVLLQLQGFAVLTGFWCLFAPLPVLFGHFLAGPFVVAGAAALVPPSLLLVRAYRREPLRFPVAVHTTGSDVTRPLTLAGVGRAGGGAVRGARLGRPVRRGGRRPLAGARLRRTGPDDPARVEAGPAPVAAPGGRPDRMNGLDRSVGWGTWTEPVTQLARRGDRYFFSPFDSR
ncbi:hypothetical protein [Methanopyrus kandleri]|uniref:hypothetical protein n=1 Tax=Methanopyrus kandleri TaxID=2320 RepID=UPI000A4AA34E|nr:hypothetical protein [Methanopyrus kandleri]